jgi:competence protein ComEC
VTLALLGMALRRGRRVKEAAALCAAGGLLLIWQPFSYSPEGGVLAVTTLDVGQGDSLFIELPDGKNMLLDGGGLPNFNPKAPPRLDMGEDVVSPYLWHQGVRRLDIVAVSHLHDDHARGLPAILRNFRPAELWAGGVPDGPSWQGIRGEAERLGTKIRFLRAGDMARFGEASFAVLAPARDYVPREKPHNDDSLVLHLRFGRHDFLLTGDLERRGELALASAEAIPDVDVLKVAHHGSKTSTTDALLDAARPRFALISAGAGNLYGHPNPVVLDRLWQLGTRTYRTDEHGMVRITTNGRHLRISTDDSTARAPVIANIP